MFDWGFFGQAVGIVFVPLALLCFERYLSSTLPEPRSGTGRIWQAGIILTVVLATLSHPVTGAAAVMGMGLYTVLSAIVKNHGKRSKLLIRGAKGILSSGILAALILAVYLLPLYQYSQVANREGLNVLALHQLPRISFPEFFGIQSADPQFILTRVANPLLATVIFACGACTGPQNIPLGICMGSNGGDRDCSIDRSRDSPLFDGRLVAAFVRIQLSLHAGARYGFAAGSRGIWRMGFVRYPGFCAFSPPSTNRAGGIYQSAVENRGRWSYIGGSGFVGRFLDNSIRSNN